MDTPRSASPRIEGAPELDDHRHQPHSLPRSGTFSNADRLRPDLSQFMESGESPGLSPVSPFSRQHRSPSVHDNPPRVRCDSPSSGSSSRSPSPPNSVDAFANPEQLEERENRRRAERSNTITSQVPSELLNLERTNSRRPTFDGDIDNVSVKAAEEDVCFPMPDEPSQTHGLIDFEEMDEFVEERNRGRVGSMERRRRMSVNEAVLSKLVPHLSSRTAVTNNESAIESSSTLNEKLQAPDDRPAERADRFSFFHSELHETIHSPDFTDLLFPGENFSQLFHGGRGVWWLDCLNPDPEEFAMLMKAFCIHPLTAEDIRTQETREKVELFKSYYFVCFRSFCTDREKDNYLEPVNVYIIVFREGVISFSFEPAGHSANVRRRIRKLRDYVALSSDWICYALIDDIVDSFAPVITQIEMESDNIEDAVFIARPEDLTHLLRRIGICRKQTMTAMRLLSGKADVVKGFSKRCNESYSVTPRGEIGLYLGDIQDHVVTMMGSLSHIEKMLSRSHANYLAQLSMDSIQANNRANEVLGKITTIATILVPLNLICGLFGMNVHVPGQDTDSLVWFFGIVAVICLFVVVSFGGAKKMKLI